MQNDARSGEDGCVVLVDLSGAGERSRTLDLRITNALLYQLSYTGVKAAIIGGQAPSWW